MTDKRYTVADVSRLTGLEVSSIRRYAINHNIGTCYYNKVRLFTPEELEELKHRRKPGRPPKDG